jgi:hypothetical protein
MLMESLDCGSLALMRANAGCPIRMQQETNDSEK